MSRSAVSATAPTGGYQSAWFLVKKEALLVFGGLLLGAAAFAAYALLWHQSFFATSIDLFIRKIPTNSVVTHYEAPGQLVSESGYSNPLFNLRELMHSQELATRVYQRIKESDEAWLAELNVKDKDGWFGVYRKLLQASIQPSTDVIRLNLRWPDAERSRSLLLLVVEEFKQLNLEVRKAIETKQRENLEQELNSITRQLDNTRQEVADFETANEVSGLEDEAQELTRSRVLLEQQAQVLRSKMANSRNRVWALSRQLGGLDAQTALQAASIGRDPYLQKLYTDLANARQRLAEEKARFTDKHPTILAIRQEITSLERSVERRLDEVGASKRLKNRQPIYDEASQAAALELSRAQAEQASLKAEYSELVAGIRRLKQKENQIPKLRQGLLSLQKTEPALEKAFQNTQEKYLEALINEHDVVDNVVLLGEPTAPTSSKKELILMLLGCLLLGGFTGFSLAWIKDGLEDRWTGLEELEFKTQKPSLGGVPWLPKVQGDTQPISHKLAFHSIGLQLIARSYADDARVLMFLSSQLHRRQPYAVPSLARTLLHAGKRVSVLDLHSNGSWLEDLEVPSLKVDLAPVLEKTNRYIRQEWQNDLSSEEARHSVEAYLLRQIKVRKLEAETLLCLTLPTQEVFDERQLSRALVTSQAFSVLVSLLRKSQDLVLIEAPSCPLGFPEITALTQLSDAAVVLVGLEASRKAVLSMVAHIEQKLKKPVMGLIPRVVNDEAVQYLNDREKVLQTALA
jgi:uncharacterized protein involved in exopolysaccharide biosynthesis